MAGIGGGEREQEEEAHELVAALRRERLGAREEADAVGDRVADEEIRDRGHGEIHQDLHQGVHLVLALHGSQLEERETRVHREHQDRAQQDEEDVGGRLRGFHRLASVRRPVRPRAHSCPELSDDEPAQAVPQRLEARHLLLHEGAGDRHLFRVQHGVEPRPLDARVAKERPVLLDGASWARASAPRSGSDLANSAAMWPFICSTASPTERSARWVVATATSNCAFCSGFRRSVFSRSSKPESAEAWLARARSARSAARRDERTRAITPF